MLKGEGEAQFNSHIGGLIIFVKDCSFHVYIDTTFVNSLDSSDDVAM